jgi:nucleoside-diphosphate-sugar epimerase
MSRGDRITVVGADVTDAAAVDAAVAGGDAVISVLGVAYTRKPVSVYSAGTANIIAAMENHGVRRLAVTSTAAVDPGYRASESAIFTPGLGAVGPGVRAIATRTATLADG